MNCLCFSPIGCHFSLLYVLYKYIYSAGHNGEKNQSVHPALLLPHWLFCATSFLTVSLLFTYTIFEWFQYKEGEGLVVSRRQTSFLPAVEDDDIKCSRLFAATKIMLFFFFNGGGIWINDCSMLVNSFAFFKIISLPPPKTFNLCLSPLSLYWLIFVLFFSFLVQINETKQKTLLIYFVMEQNFNK